ncbi:MAG TPA: ester cyclase [Acidimicrobiia bacterium]|nr:ester cyclase [Acidimicrobiia bacterium]
MVEAAALQHDMFEAIGARDFEKIRDLYHPEYTYRDADGSEHKGADAGVAVAEMYTKAFPDLEFELVSQYAVNDHVSVMEIVVRGTHEGDLEGLAPTGNRVEVFVCNVVECRNGLIWRERDYFDNLSIMRQLGVIDT